MCGDQETIYPLPWLNLMWSFENLWTVHVKSTFMSDGNYSGDISKFAENYEKITNSS